MRKIIIGIDPDCNKSGVAYLIKKTVTEAQLFQVDRLSFFELLKMLQEQKETREVEVFIESGWENKKSNYHLYANQSKEVGEMIAKKVGANHEVGRKIVEMCEYLEIKHTLIRPTSSKITATYFEQLTRIKVKGKDKQDLIDAGMLIIGR
jgi:hypothetical protein